MGTRATDQNALTGIENPKMTDDKQHYMQEVKTKKFKSADNKKTLQFLSYCAVFLGLFNMWVACLLEMARKIKYYEGVYCRVDEMDVGRNRHRTLVHMAL